MLRKFFAVFGVALVSLTLALHSPYADAAKFGGKRSFGKSYRTAPAQQAQPVGNKQPAATPAASGARKGMMGGLLGGLLAGGLLAWMFGSGAFQGLQIMDMLIMAGVAFLLYRLFRGMMQQKTSAMGQHAPVGAAGGNTQPYQAVEAPTEHSSSQAGFSTISDVPFNLPAGFELQPFLNGARDHFRTLQEAWNKNDLSKIQEYVSPELYNDLVAERRQHPGEQHTEVMFVDAEMVRADQDGRTAQISIRFQGRYRDTVENVEEQIDEVWHLERNLTQPDSPWHIVGIQQ